MWGGGEGGLGGLCLYRERGSDVETSREKKLPVKAAGSQRREHTRLLDQRLKTRTRENSCQIENLRDGGLIFYEASKSKLN